MDLLADAGDLLPIFNLNLKLIIPATDALEEAQDVWVPHAEFEETLPSIIVEAASVDDDSVSLHTEDLARDAVDVPDYHTRSLESSNSIGDSCMCQSNYGFKLAEGCFGILMHSCQKQVIGLVKLYSLIASTICDMAPEFATPSY